MAVALSLVENPLSPARAELRRATEALIEAQAGLAEAQEPVARLTAVTGEIGQLEAKLAGLRHHHDEAVGEWIARGDLGAERPEIAPAATGIERRLVKLHRDLPGVRSALPAAEERVQRCAERVSVLHGSRQEALHTAAVEAAAEVVEHEYRSALETMLQIESRVRSVADALRANRAEPAALAVSNMISKAQAAAAVSRDPGPGRRLLEALARDAVAALA